MRAKIRQFSAGSWRTIEVTTNPLRAKVEGGTPEGFDVKSWALSLPPVLLDGKSTRLQENPEGWLERMSRMVYTRITVELID